MTKGKDNKNRAVRKEGFFDPKVEVDHVMKMIDLGAEGKELRAVIKRTIEYAYKMGQSKGRNEIRDEWIEYLKEQIERKHE